MPTYRKRDFPVSDIRRFLEPGPVVLVSSAHKGERNIMTMGWHMVMEFVPSLVGCLISSGNHSYELIRRSKECVINIPTVELAPDGRENRQLLGRRRRQVRQVQAHRGCRRAGAGAADRASATPASNADWSTATCATNTIFSSSKW